jgi:hypothetical protein
MRGLDVLTLYRKGRGMEKNRYLLPGGLLLAGMIGFALFDGYKPGELVSQLLSALGLLGLIYRWRTKKTS